MYIYLTQYTLDFQILNLGLFPSANDFHVIACYPELLLFHVSAHSPHCGHAKTYLSCFYGIIHFEFNLFSEESLNSITEQLEPLRFFL